MERSSRAAILGLPIDVESPEPLELDRRLLDLDIAFFPPLPHPYDLIADIVEDIIERAQQHLLNLHLDREDEENRVQVSTQRAGKLWPVEKSSYLENSVFCSRALSCNSCLYATGKKGTHAFAVSEVNEDVDVISPLANDDKATEVVISKLVVGDRNWDILACSTEGQINGESEEKATGRVTVFAFNNDYFATLACLGEQEGLTSQLSSLELSPSCDILATALAGTDVQPGLIVLHRLPRLKWQSELANFKQQVESTQEDCAETGGDVDLAAVASTVHVNFSKPVLALRIRQPLSVVQAMGVEGLAAYQMPSFMRGFEGCWSSVSYTKARLVDFQRCFCPDVSVDQLAEDIRTVDRPGTAHIRLLKRSSQGHPLADVTTHCAVWFEGSAAYELFFYALPPTETKATDATGPETVQTFSSHITMASNVTVSGWLAVAFEDDTCLVQDTVEGVTMASAAIPKTFGCISCLLLTEVMSTRQSSGKGSSLMHQSQTDGTLVIGCQSGAVLFLPFSSFRTNIAAGLEYCRLSKHCKPGLVVDLCLCQRPSPDLVLSVHEDGALLFHQLSTFQALHILQPPQPFVFRSVPGSVALSQDGHFLFAQCVAVRTEESTSKSKKQKMNKKERTEFAVCHINLDSLSWPQDLYESETSKDQSLQDLCSSVTLGNLSSMACLWKNYFQTFEDQSEADQDNLMTVFKEGEGISSQKNLHHSQKLQENLQTAREFALENLDRYLLIEKSDQS